MMLESLRSAGLTNDAIAAILSKESGRKAPSCQRVQDWISGPRNAPAWVNQALAAHIASLWEQDRRQYSKDPDAVGRVDAKWSRMIDPVLGELYAALSCVPMAVRVHFRGLKSAIRIEIEARFNVELPGI